jgi:hypothetical protein
MTVLVVARGTALIDRILPLINAGGVRAFATTEDDEALENLETGEISTLVIGGGVERESRHRLQSAAEQNGVRVIEGHARGKDPEAYVRDELLPALERTERE